MKNLKLLLATTAILSTGALIANADVNLSGTFDVSVDLVNELQVSCPTDLSFGKVAYVANTSMYLTSAGNVFGSAHYYTGAHPGIIRLSSSGTSINNYLPAEMSIGDEGSYARFTFENLILKDNNNVACASATASASISDTTIDTTNGYIDVPFIGTLSFDQGYTGNANHCSGSGQVTVILDTMEEE